MTVWGFLGFGMAITCGAWLFLPPGRGIGPLLAFAAFFPRMGLIFSQNGHGDAEGSLGIVRIWFSTGKYNQRWPGVPVYDVLFGLLDRAASELGLPYFYLTNLFSASCVLATLFCLYFLFIPFVGERKSLAAVLLFNFFPQELVVGAATYELSLLVALLAAAWLAYSKSRPNLALFLAVLAVGAKLSALAFVVPLTLALIIDDFRKRRLLRLTAHAFLPALGIALIFVPRFLASRGLGEFIAPFFGAPVYHADISRFTRYGAFLLRTGNLLGPLGVPLLVGLVAIRFRLLAPFRREGVLVAAAYSIILLYFMLAAPWEAYYLLPLVPVTYFLVFYLNASRGILCLFVFSNLLPLVVQIQLKPWKLPPWEVRDGVVNAHVNRVWVVRGGG